MATNRHLRAGLVPSAPQPAEQTLQDDNALIKAIERSDNQFVKKLDQPVKAVSRLSKRVMTLKPYRVFRHYSFSDGNLLAAGMSFQALFAIFAAVFVGFAIAGLWISGNSALYTALVDIINRAVPGLLADGDSPGVIDPSTLLNTSFYGWTGVIAIVGLLWTAIAWLFFTRQAIRAVFRLPRDTTNFVLQKVVDLGLALAFGIVLIIGAAASVLSTQALSWIFELIGIGQNSGWADAGTRLLGLIVAVVLNFITLGVMYRVLSRIKIPWRDLFTGALIGSIALAILSALSGLLIRGATSNPLLATFAVFIGLLLWFNLNCRVILLAASWIAIGVSDQGLKLVEETPAQRVEREREARRLVAEADLAEARRSLAEARGPFVKWRASRRVRIAEENLRHE